MAKHWQAVFIDRDGTIGGTGHFTSPEEFILFQGVQASIESLKNAGLKVIAFTNQTRISSGEVTENEFRMQFNRFGFDDALICPHQVSDGCNCRKPSPRLLYSAAERYGLDLTKCVVIGDRWTDLIAAHEAGAQKILVKTGSGEADLTKYHDNLFYGKWREVSPDFVANHLNEAVGWILDCRS